MSESNFPFGGTAVQEPPAPVQPAEDGVAGRDRRKLFLVGGIAGVLVLAVAAYFLLFSGGGSSNDTSFVVPHHVVKPKAAAAAQAPKAVTVPKTNSAPVGRDPFKALVTPPVAAASAAPGASAAPAPAASAGTTGTTGTTTTQTKPVSPVWIELDSFTATTGTFRVAYSDGSTRVWQNVKAPASGSKTTFATYFALLKISGGVATVQMGDGKPFDLKQGFANRHFV